MALSTGEFLPAAILARAAVSMSSALCTWSMLVERLALLSSSSTCSRRSSMAVVMVVVVMVVVVIVNSMRVSDGYDGT